MEKQRCYYCGSQALTVRYDLGAHKILKCRECALMQLSPMPSVTDTASVYSDIFYFQNQQFYDLDHGNLYGYVDYIAERVNKLREHRPIAEFLRDRYHRLAPAQTSPRLRLLDVGCGLGYFLDVAQDVGFEVVGVEFNPGAVRAIRNKYAFTVHEGAVETSPLEESSFDVITMFDVIEHLHDPRATILHLHKLLRPGGGIAISTMDSESLMSRLLGKRLEDFRRTSEHLFFFSRTTLTNLLEKTGYRVHSIKSYGHTFELAFLLERLAIINRPVFLSLHRLVKRLGIGRWRVSVDPHTKMIVFADKL